MNKTVPVWLICGWAAVAGAGEGEMRLVQTIPLPGVEGRIDHMAADVAEQRLFICALGNNTLEVVDLASTRRIRSVRGFAAPQGVTFVPAANRLFVADAKGGVCHVLDSRTFSEISRLNFEDDADNVRLDAAGKTIVVGYGDGALGLVNAASGELTGHIPLPGHPESFQLESSGPRIYVNVPAAHHVIVVDREKRTIVARWSPGLALANYPMAFDEAAHRLFVGCRVPARLCVFDTVTGKIVDTAGIGGDTDDLFVDARRGRVYAVCGSGSVEVLVPDTAGHYRVVGRTATASGARTGLFVPELDSLFVAVPHRGAQPAELRRYALND